jgi:transportin-3
LEDYLQMLLQLAEFRPDVFFLSEAFPLAFESAMAALTLVHSDIIFAALDLFRMILTHDSLAPATTTPPPPKFPTYASAIVTVIEAAGFYFLRYLLHGLVGNFPEDAVSAVVTIFRSMAALCSSQMLSWVPAVTEELPLSMVPSQAKTQFLTGVNRFVGVLLVAVLCVDAALVPSPAANTTRLSTPSSLLTECRGKLKTGDAKNRGGKAHKEKER